MMSLEEKSRPLRRPWLAVCLAAALAASASVPTARAQQDAAGPSGAASDVTAAPAPPDTGASQVSSQVRESAGPNLFSLFWASKWFMLPILAMSVLVVAVSIERMIGLRQNRVLPDELVERLGAMGGAGFDPREAYRVCQQFPSAAATVIRAMLFKVGRPHSEVEKAVEDVSAREAQRMYANVRWLNLAAVVTPLMGLFGTVWGMIWAFHHTTTLAPGLNKAEDLAEGIYLALVTTLGGLAVAIPASILAHYFEGRVESLFHRVDELLFNLMPQIERYEGRVRFNRAVEAEPPPREAAEAPPPAPMEGRPAGAAN